MTLLLGATARSSISTPADYRRCWTCTIDLVNGDRFFVGSSTPGAIVGYPTVTVPAGFAFRELPIGVSFFASAWSEPTLIKLAYAFEQATRARKAPRFLHSLDLP